MIYYLSSAIPGKILSRLLVLFFSVILIGTASAQNASADLDSYFAPVPGSYYQNLAFNMPEVTVPDFPDYSVNIKEFGAVPDGKTLNTEAFAKAIDNVSQHGGGTVVISRGVWLTGPIKLKSNINLYTKKGALVLFSKDFDLYPLIRTSYEGVRTMRNTSPITGDQLENVAITGQGVFDGNGQAWRPVKKGKMTPGQWKDLVNSGGYLNRDKDIWYPTSKAIKGSRTPRSELKTREDYEAIKDYLRPVMVSIRHSKNVLLDGPTFQNSPAWCLHPLMDENVVIRNVMVRNPWYAQNGDGLDVESVSGAVIYNNSFDVGDDGICIKSGKNEAGRKRGMPTHDVIVRDNTVYHGHGGFVVGSEMSGGVNNIDVSNLIFIGTDVGLRFKSTRGRGGVVENIYISNINMIDIATEPIRFNLFYGGEAPDVKAADKEVDKEALKAEIPHVTVETPQFKDIHIKNILCKGAGSALYFQGLPEMNFKNVTLNDVHIEADKGGIITDTDQLSMKNVSITVRESPALFLQNVHHIDLSGLQYHSEGEGAALSITGPFTESVRLNTTSDSVHIGPNVEKRAINEE